MPTCGGAVRAKPVRGARVVASALAQTRALRNVPPAAVSHVDRFQGLHAMLRRVGLINGEHYTTVQAGSTPTVIVVFSSQEALRRFDAFFSEHEAFLDCWGNYHVASRSVPLQCAHLRAFAERVTNPLGKTSQKKHGLLVVEEGRFRPNGFQHDPYRMDSAKVFVFGF